MTPSDAALDPRRIITQEAFSVAPELLGTPLARPSRRLVAILLDLLFVVLLVNVGGAVLLGIASAFAFFRFAGRGLDRGGSFFGRSARLALRGFGAFILFVVGVSVFGSVRDLFDGDDDPPVRAAAAPEPEMESREVSPAAALRAVGGFVQLQQADDSASTAGAVGRVVGEMRAAGVPDDDIREAVLSAARDNPWAAAAVDQALAAEGERPLGPDSLAVLYAAAVRADSAAAETLGARLGSALARDSLRELHGTVQSLRSEVETLREREREREESGLLDRLLRLLDDLGLSFGWNALYFTAFTALWRGQTPGKRLLGIRVVRLNGQPMTLWMSFERFGGYAAGLLTGLLGFAQVYWDRNRQAIHDKITETVVVRDRGSPAAAVAPPRPPTAPDLASAPRPPFP